MDQNSSYYKVYVALTKTSTYRAIIDEIREGLATATIDAMYFEAEVRGEGTDAKAVVYPVFHVKYGKIGGEYPWKWNPPRVTDVDWSISSSKLWNAARINDIIKNHFGPRLDVKTRNCKLQMLENGSYSRHIDSFYTWMTERLTLEFRDLIKETRDRLTASCHKVLNSEEYSKSKDQATITFCKNGITNVMMQWRHMPDHILKEAWDQFIATTVMCE